MPAKKEKADRFDLEQQILTVENICDDLDLIADAVLNDELDVDDVANMLIGLSALTRLRSQRLFNTFEEALDLKSYP